MLPNNESVLTVEGSLGGEKTAMSIDLASLPHLMSVLTDLYSDPEMAVIREYSTNALDAHIEAGIVKPIEVTLPSTLSPYFKVKDYGVGLSVNEITEIYSKYGASTKRDTNDQIGMLGLGCKSALTYTQNFTLVSRKDGIKISANISRIEDGTGAIEIIDTCKTDEPNGVEIVVPTKRWNEFGKKSLRFFQYWEAGKVLIDGKEPVGREDWHKVTDDIFMVPNRSTDYIVMGNVAYPTSHRIGNYGSFGVVAFVPIGAVNFTPSREALHYTKTTESTIKDIASRFESAIAISMQKEISAAPNHAEAMKIYSRLYSEFRYGRFTHVITNLVYKGEKFPESWKVNCINWAPNRYRNAAQSYSQIAFSSVSQKKNVLFIKGFSFDNLTATYKKKIKKYAEDNDITLNEVYLVDEAFGAPWTDGLGWVDFDDIKAIKLTVPKTRVYKEPGFDIWDGKKWTIEDTVPAKDEIIFYSSAEKSVNFRALHKSFPSAKIVMLPKNRWDKFKREHPNAKHARTAIEPLREKAGKILTKEDIEYLTQVSRGRREWMRLDAGLIDDPELVRLINLCKYGEQSKTLIEYRSIVDSLNGMGIRIPAPDLGTPYELTNKYRLFRSDYYVTQDVAHSYLYINAVYKANKEAK